MKCLKRVQMEEFILDANAVNSSRNIHVLSCPRCQALLHDIRKEQEVWGEMLFPERLTDDFTRQVMASLADVQIEPPAEEESVRPRAKTPSRIIWMRRAALWAACLLIVAAALTVYAQPSIADWVRSIFAKNNVASDIGLLGARQIGLVQNPHVKVKDKGYTFEINEVVVDATRMMMGVKITDPHGKPVVNEVDWSGVTVKDTQGNELAELHPLGGSAVIENVWSLLKDGVKTDELIVEGNIDQVGNEYYSKRIVKGHWNFKFTLDMKKANELTVATPLHQQYTSPDGLHFEIEKLVRTPSGVRLELSTSLREEAAKRSPGSVWEGQDLMFHFEDEQGNIISSVNSNEGGSHYEMAPPTHAMVSGKVHWTYTFTYLPYDSKQLRFVLDGYTLPILSGKSFPFTSEELSKHPAVFKDQGDTIELNAFHIGQDPNYREKKIAGLISMKGTFINGFNQDEWVLKNHDGNEYAINFRGSVEMGEIKKAEGDPGFIVDGLTTLPEKATLIRKVTDKWYSNVKWSFDLPKGEPIKGLENVDPESYWKAP